MLYYTRQASIFERASSSERNQLRGSSAPIVVSEFQITERLPDEFISSLPSAEQLSAEFSGDDENDLR